VTPLDYDYLRKLLKDRSGLVLSVDKQYLVESRLTPLARKAGIASLGELVAKLRSNNERLAVDVVEAMTTNESFFYRDKIPFDHFRDTIMPGLLAARARERRLRIWCAAASTGQEPYSLAMCLKEMKDKLVGWRVEILGTDLSTEVLEKAKAGVYSQFEVQRGLPIQMLVKHFSQVGDTWHISPEIRAMVQYRPLNLLSDFAHLGSFDVVFCRNVLIYFDQETKIGVLNRIAKLLDPEGFLVLGAAETVVGLTDAFKPLADKRGLYAPNRDAVKPGFGAQDWFNAAQWQSRRGVVGPADAVGRAAILNVLPAGARSAAVMKLIPPWPWLASVRRAWPGGRSRQQRCRLTCAAVSRHSSAPDSGRMPRQTDSTDRRRPAIDVAPNGEYGRRSRTGGQAPVR